VGSTLSRTSITVKIGFASIKNACVRKSNGGGRRPENVLRKRNHVQNPLTPAAISRVTKTTLKPEGWKGKESWGLGRPDEGDHKRIELPWETARVIDCSFCAIGAGGQFVEGGGDAGKKFTGSAFFLLRNRQI